jgi:hypothetical protein
VKGPGAHRYRKTLATALGKRRLAGIQASSQRFVLLAVTSWASSVTSGQNPGANASFNESAVRLSVQPQKNTVRSVRHARQGSDAHCRSVLRATEDRTCRQWARRAETLFRMGVPLAATLCMAATSSRIGSGLHGA